jgi:hypothetical protein
VTSELLIIAFGLFATAMGIYAYVGKHAARLHRYHGPFVNVVYSYLPYGLAFTLIGLAIITGPGPWDGPLVLAGFALATFGIILWFWHPNWIRPKWLRNSWGD